MRPLLSWRAVNHVGTVGAAAAWTSVSVDLEKARGIVTNIQMFTFQEREPANLEGFELQNVVRTYASTRRRAMAWL